MEKAGSVNKESAPFDIEKFYAVSGWQAREFYHLYQFSDSVPANKAETLHFLISTNKVNSCDIFPETEHTTIRVDFHFIALSRATAAVTAVNTAAVAAATAAASIAYSTKLMSIHERER